MENLNRPLKEIISRLRNKGFRLTPQRLCVLEFLLGDADHPTIDEIYQSVIKEFPMTSLATVYKTVNALKDLGEISELSFSKGANRYDINRISSHPHLICLKCNKIIDPEIGDLIPQANELAARHGFELSHYRLDFFGICSDCQGKS